MIVALHQRAMARRASLSNSSSTPQHFHVPYRNSMLTSVLRDSLGGNCKTVRH